MRHTPGPWRVRELVDGHLAVYGQGEYEAVASRKTGLLSADAALIAAAPELLEACQQALEFAKVYGPGECRTVEMLKAAIAKAEGRDA